MNNNKTNFILFFIRNYRFKPLLILIIISLILIDIILFIRLKNIGFDIRLGLGFIAAPIILLNIIINYIVNYKNHKAYIDLTKNEQHIETLTNVNISVKKDKTTSHNGYFNFQNHNYPTNANANILLTEDAIFLYPFKKKSFNYTFYMPLLITKDSKQKYSSLTTLVIDEKAENDNKLTLGFKSNQLNISQITTPSLKFSFV